MIFEGFDLRVIKLPDSTFADARYGGSSDEMGAESCGDGHAAIHDPLTVHGS